MSADASERFSEIQREIYRHGYYRGRADAIEEYRKEMHDMIDGNEEFIDWQKYEILECNDLVAEQLKERKQ